MEQENVIRYFILYIALFILYAGHVARMGEMMNAYSILVGKPERKTTGKTKT
jgi:hypothetical protein